MANIKRVEKGTPVTVWLDEDTLELIDGLAEKADMSRSRLLRNLIKVGADELRTMDKWGLIKLMRMVEAATGSVKEIIKKVLGSGPSEKGLSNGSEEQD